MNTTLINHTSCFPQRKEKIEISTYKPNACLTLYIFFQTLKRHKMNKKFINTNV